jgi:phosphoglycolate phosphatase-like HAD superfamily hydrolase
LFTCAQAEGLGDLFAAIPQEISRMVVSGSAQDELRHVLEKRELAPYFTAIYGSPDSKTTILARERERGNIKYPALFIGDSRYDYEAAKECGLDFVFVSDWTEFSHWQDYFADKNIRVYGNLQNMLNDEKG